MRGFRIPFDGHILVGDIMAGEAPPRLVVLHGAGQSCRERFLQLREHFFTHSVGSVAFDCIGHGDTGGDLRSTSLRSRTEQACAVIGAAGLTRPFSILAASMGGYTAVTLLQRYDIANLVLIGPAMYAAAAYAVPFNGGFTEIIRRPQSWEASDAWDILSGFAGRLLVVAGECDTVIPPGVIQRIYESAAIAKERAVYVAPGVSHLIITDLRVKDPERLDRLLDLMTQTLRGDADSDRPQNRQAAMES